MSDVCTGDAVRLCCINALHTIELVAAHMHALPRTRRELGDRP